jgi:hypothetical protein
MVYKSVLELVPIGRMLCVGKRSFGVGNNGEKSLSHSRLFFSSLFMSGPYTLLQFGADPFSSRFEDLEGRPAFTVYVFFHHYLGL